MWNGKYYCIQDYNSLLKLREGHVYEVVNGILYYDNGQRGSQYKSWESFKEQNPTISSCLVKIEGSHQRYDILNKFME